MCNQQIFKYVQCGCKRDGLFEQCAERTGTIARCDKIETNVLNVVETYCRKHTVPTTAVTMQKYAV
ncbi:uncharacterized protein EV420DRAFT_1523463 [Desarmillaria tabescens]|uniref:Uncharacterized protein n=1 Tax=Armillaria tabescens TaxID=1929756 RepID=A0AA39TLH1_ARMTA|nr:uncharacterized protein EV420DRAFT_1523463 [Desarmillaria tabescens]KAK0463242.1 hypothetical protein EV420DRAFT_1523463 [Desarmillaria tabescens]